MEAGIIVAGTAGVPGADGTWDVYGIDGSGRYVTAISPATGPGNIVPIGSFTPLTGSVTMQSMTAYVVADLSPYINGLTVRFFSAFGAVGMITVTGSEPLQQHFERRHRALYCGQPGANFFGPGAGRCGHRCGW